VNIWLLFFLSSLAVIIAGARLSRYGDIIALKTKLGRALVGSILIAGATSLPELVTVLSSTIIGALDIAAGNIFGSILFNLALLALMDLVQGSGPLMLEVHFKHIINAQLGILLSGLAVLFIIINHFNYLSFSFWGVGMGGIVIIAVYFIGTRLNFRYEKFKASIDDKKKQIVNINISLQKVLIRFFAAAFVIIISGSVLSYSADLIAEQTGLRQSFMGTILVAAATSLPEMVTVLSAVKIGAYNMAAGNVFGSNIFNILILGLADIVYRPGSFLGAISLTNALTALLGIVLSTIAVLGLFYRSQKSILKLGWDSISILIIYFFGLYIIFRMGIAI